MVSCCNCVHKQVFSIPSFRNCPCRPCLKLLLLLFWFISLFPAVHVTSRIDIVFQLSDSISSIFIYLQSSFCLNTIVFVFWVFAISLVRSALLHCSMCQQLRRPSTMTLCQDVQLWSVSCPSISGTSSSITNGPQEVSLISNCHWRTLCRTMRFHALFVSLL